MTKVLICNVKMFLSRFTFLHLLVWLLFIAVHSEVQNSTFATLSNNVTAAPTTSISRDANSLEKNKQDKFEATSLNINSIINNQDSIDNSNNLDGISINNNGENSPNGDISLNAGINSISNQKKSNAKEKLKNDESHGTTEHAQSAVVQPPHNINSIQNNVDNANLNSQQNGNIASASAVIIAASSTSLPFLKIGNTTIADACQMNKVTFTQLVQFYPRHCTSLSDSSDTGDVLGNLTEICGDSNDLPRVGAAEQEHLSSLSIFLILCVLGLCILLIFFLLKTKLHYLPESVACVLVGALIGLVLKILSSQNIANWQKEEAFSPTVFFLVFLPPIIFESGYNLHKGNFFQNIGSILVFAIVGTAVSALVVGGGVYLLGEADVVYPLSFVESFAFGSLISAVDPVATLALFNALQVDPILYMLVFGESILNDAVSIVLTTSVLEMPSYGPDMSAGAGLGYFLWRFFVMFLGSAGIGVFFALLSALTLKHVALRDYTSLELCIVIIFIYAPYTLAEGIHLSGIMAILFSGIVMSHYTHYNLSPVLQITVQHLMRTLAFTAECIVFIYLGMALFSFKHQFHGALVGWSVVLCLLGRAFNIFPLAWLVNKFRDHPITPKMQFIMWFSGLRGAIAYALSLHLEFSDEKRHVLVTTTLFIVLFTIFILGSSVVPLIKYVEISKKQATKNKMRARQKQMLTLSKTREWGQAIDSEHYSEFTEEESSEGPHIVPEHQLRGFLKLDQHYLRPLFCRSMTHQEIRSHANDLKRQCYQSLNVVPSDSEEEMFSMVPTQHT